MSTNTHSQQYIISGHEERSLSVSFSNGFLLLLYRILLKNVMRVIFGIQFSDNKVIKAHKQFIIVANHNSHADAMAIMASLPSCVLINTCSIAAHDYFGKNPITSFFMKYLVNAKLIDRKKGGRDVIEQIDRLIKRGKSIIIFPEGSRGNPGQVQEFKKGAAILLKKNPQIPYIPIYLHGLDMILPKGKYIPLPYNSQVIIGEAQFVSESESVEMITEKIKSDIFELPFCGTV
jgi:1-acyl-sn-glycerol-3-phosphate acyltransferase